MQMNRRGFLETTAAAAAALALPQCASGRRDAGRPPEEDGRASRILFHSRGAIGIVDADGGAPEYLRLEVPGQVGWHAGLVLSGSDRILLMSVEGKKTWEHNVRSHLWLYGLRDHSLDEIAEDCRLATYMPPCTLLPGEQRLVVNPVIEGEQRIAIVDLEGGPSVEVTHRGEGFSYGVSLSPDAARLAFHATGQGGYRIFVTELDGSNRTLVAGGPGHLYFGPTWSPDGEWLLYLDCHDTADPGHDWADLCLGRPDGSEHRVVTQEQRHWFGTSYGSPDTRGGGSNIPRWSPRRPVCTYTRALPGSRTAWPYHVGRPDTDHFNRDYRPEQASGGTQLCILDPFTGDAAPVTTPGPLVWDFRTEWSPDGNRIAFCRAPVGEPSELWVMESDGTKPRPLAKGIDDLGADHPVWV